MDKIPENLFVRTDIWREGKWLDLWSVVHFLSGMSVGFGIYFLHLDPLPAVVIAFLSFTLYEMWEAVAKIEETPANRFMDVVVGMASFTPTFFYLAPRLSSQQFLPVFGTVLIMNITMSIFGWRASRKAAALEKRIREEYEIQRERLRRRRKLLKKKKEKAAGGL